MMATERSGHLRARRSQSYRYAARLPLGEEGSTPELLLAELAARPGVHVLEGSPRTGKSSILLRAAVAALESGIEASNIVMLAPTRARATMLREDLVRLASSASQRVGGSGLITVMTPLGFAYSLVARHASKLGQAAPSLVTGAEADVILHDILASGVVEWPEQVHEGSLLLPGFRNELRDLIGRASERGIGPKELERIALARNKPQWLSAAAVYRIYLEVLALQSSSAIESGQSIDASELIAGAITHLKQATRFELVLVDDVQDLTAAGFRLVAQLIENSPKVLIAQCPDVAVEGFRGGLPDAGSRLIEQLRASAGQREVTHWLLTRAPHAHPAISELVSQMRMHLPLAGATAASRKPWIHPQAPTSRKEENPSGSSAVPGFSPVACATVTSEDLEARLIATAIRVLLAEHNVEPSTIAVVCRSHTGVAELAQRLDRLGIATETPLHSIPLRDHRVIQDFLSIVEWGMGAAHPSPDDLVQLLRGPWGECDELRIREIRRALLALYPEGQSAELLRTVLEADTPVDLTNAGPQSRRAILRALGSYPERIRRMRQAASEHHASGVLSMLWEVWDAAGLATQWQNRALNHSSDSERLRAREANSRLDALGALFTAADRYEERGGGSDPLVFIERIRAQAVPEDTLSPRAHIGGRVRVSTPASLAGEGMHSVIVAGLNEGAWPNLRLRSSALGAAELALLHDFPGTADDRASIRAASREAVLADEIRLLVAAASRAQEFLLITAIDDGSTVPSELFHVCRTHIQRYWPHGTWVDSFSPSNAPGPYPDERQLVASILREIRRTDPTSEGARESLTQLNSMLEDLRTNQVAAAEPASWYHKAPTTRAPFLEPQATVRLSPSSLQLAHQCPRAFILEGAGARAGAGGSQNLGTVIHALAEGYPTAGPTELITHFEKLQGALAEDATWVQRQERERALSILEKLGTYQSAHPEVEAVEKRFRAVLGNVELVGTIDRIEHDAQGLRIVDYKTGKNAETQEQALRNLQLAAYQEGLAHDPDFADVTISGASLVYVGTDALKATMRHQPTFSQSDNPEWFRETIAELSSILRQPQISLARNEHCKICPVASSCPLQREGAHL